MTAPPSLAPALLAVAAQASASEDRKIWAVVGGLVVVALALTALTVRYWRITRPDRPAEPVEGGRSRRRRSRSGRDRREPARAGDGPTVAALLDELDDDDIFVSTPTTPSTVTAEVARVPSTTGDATPGSPDHEAADDDWRSRATGEHPIVQRAPARTITRPSREQRSRALGQPR